jgi:hypothetical protein
VNPTRSANSTVTRRRSAAGAAAGAGGAGRAGAAGEDGAEGGAEPESRLPQAPQNRWPADVGVPHEGQTAICGAPHSTQNFIPAGTSAPQLPQRIAPPAPGAYRIVFMERP